MGRCKAGAPRRSAPIPARDATGRSRLASVFDRRSDALDLIARQIVQDDDVAALELGNEELLGPSAERLAVDRPVERARRDETVLPQRADEGRRLPMAPWNRRDEALAARISRKAGSFWSMRRFRRQTPDCAGAIRPAAPAIAGALPRCRGGLALRRAATFFERQPEMTDPRPQAADTDLHPMIVRKPGLQLALP